MPDTNDIKAASPESPSTDSVSAGVESVVDPVGSSAATTMLADSKYPKSKSEFLTRVQNILRLKMDSSDLAKAVSEISELIPD